MKIYVLDTETTGLSGAAFGEKVVEIGICCVNLEKKTVEPVWDTVVGYDVTRWTEEEKHSWIFENTDLTIDDVAHGMPWKNAVRKTRRILDGKLMTSYNVDFDFDRFLLHAPWNLRGTITPCIMQSAHRLVDGDHVFEDGTSWPRLQKSYKELCPDDPAGMNGPQTHRALSDAIQAAHVMIALHERGAYKTEAKYCRKIFRSCYECTCCDKIGYMRDNMIPIFQCANPASEYSDAIFTCAEEMESCEYFEERDVA